MFVLREPSPEQIGDFLASQRNSNFSYPHTGATRTGIPRGFVIDHNRMELGRGQDAFERAKRALCAWKMFALSWLNLSPKDARIIPGTTVAVVSRQFGFWALNGCRIVYTIDEPDRFGFAYGTLSAHAEIGEERFTVELQPSNESVWYDILAFSKPRPSVRLAYPFARMLQKRFARDSMAAMRQAVATS
ncbi:MAG TPA: DUF1990 domain-containing protein [Bryobacteraceae bacterium]|nr:DUF1990 domain-containing protein [Bryobacteraceae bacterium]